MFLFGARRNLAWSPGSAAVSPAKRSLCCVPGGNALDDCVRLLPALYRSFAVGFLLFGIQLSAHDLHTPG